MSLCLSVGVNDSIRIEPMTTCDVCGSIGIESVNFIRVCVCLVSFICVGTFACDPLVEPYNPYNPLVETYNPLVETL